MTQQTNQNKPFAAFTFSQEMDDSTFLRNVGGNQLGVGKHEDVRITGLELIDSPYGPQIQVVFSKEEGEFKSYLPLTYREEGKPPAPSREFIMLGAALFQDPAVRVEMLKSKLPGNPQLFTALNGVTVSIQIDAPRKGWTVIEEAGVFMLKNLETGELVTDELITDFRSAKDFAKATDRKMAYNRLARITAPTDTEVNAAIVQGLIDAEVRKTNVTASKSPLTAKPAGRAVAAKPATL